MAKTGKKLKDMLNPQSPRSEILTRMEEKPLGEITLADLLDCSPDVRTAKKESERSIFKGQSSRGRGAFNSGTSSLVQKFSTPTPMFSLESSKLATLKTADYAEPFDKLGKRKLKRMRKEERDKTKGSGWFNLPCPEMTQERKNDLEALSLRGALDKKHFYKRNNIPVRPKYFQVGRIIEAPADFYHSRVPKRQRKQTMAEEMVAEVSSTMSHL
jgi:hypothetical protein